MSVAKNYGGKAPLDKTNALALRGLFLLSIVNATKFFQQYIVLKMYFYI